MKQILTGVISLAAILCTALTACDRVVIAPRSVEPLYKELAAYNTMPAAQRDSFVRADSMALTAMFGFLDGSRPTDSVLERWSQSAPVRVFTPAVDSVFRSLKSIEANIGRIETNARTNGFVLPNRRFAAVVWGSPKSVVLTDSCVLIALNHYLGEKYAGYAGWPEYMRRQKTPEQLPYDVTEALVATEFPYRPGHDATLLSRIAYEGALIMTKVKLVPQGSLSGALGCSTEDLQWLEQHQSDIWNRLVAKELLYSTSSEVASRLVDPAPNTSLLGTDVPGRAGRFLGYYLILQYLQSNPETSLPSLLQPDFYNNPVVLINE